MKEKICDCDFFCQREEGKFCTKWENVVPTTVIKKTTTKNKK